MASSTLKAIAKVSRRRVLSADKAAADYDELVDLFVQGQAEGLQFKEMGESCVPPLDGGTVGMAVRRRREGRRDCE